MAEAVIGRRLLQAALPAAVLEWVLAHREALAVASIMAIAAVLRFADLGTMALHHDESLHARYTWLLFDGQGYQHNPLMHGPFLFHSGAVVYFLFGDSDATSRFLPALFGTLLVGMPYLLRRQIGMPAVLIAAVLLAVSPTILYFSRFYRNELYMLVWTLGLVICMWRYLDERKERYLYIMAAVLALSFATKEVTFITAAIFLLFLNFMLAVDLGRRREDEDVDTLTVTLRTAAIAPFAWIIAAVWPLLPGRPFSRERMPPAGDLLLLFGLLTMPQFAAAVQSLPFVTNYGYNAPQEETLRLVTVTSLLLLSAYAGLLWRPKVFAIAALCFYAPYVVLYTTVFTNMEGFFSGIWGSLDYWLDQHHVKRGNQPGYYYALLTPLYEFLPMLPALAGGVWLALRGDWLRRWFVFWLAGIFIGLTLAGEKMPWLEAHIALPLILVAALSLARAIDVLELTGTRWLPAVALAAATVVAVLLLVEGGGAGRLIGALLCGGIGGWLVAGLLRDTPRDFLPGLPRALSATELHVTVLVAAVVAVVLALASVAGPFAVDVHAALWATAVLPLAVAGYAVAHLLLSSKNFGRGLLVVGVVALLTLTVRASLMASFQHRDTPVEMLVYTQTSPDIPRIRDRIDALARASGLGYNLPIVVDTHDSYAWPWAWYLRHYNEVSYATITPGYEAPPNAVLLIHRGNAGRIDETAYTTAPYRHRWWFCETYRDYEGNCRTDHALDFRDASRIVTDPARLGSLANFWLHRRDAAGSTGSVDGVAFFPQTLAAFDTAPAPQGDPREPVRLGDGRIVIGAGDGSGSRRPGEFLQPAGLFVDVQGNIWVADGVNNRVQKFDANGNFVAQVASTGAAPGGLNEPWSVAVDAEGSVYVADTWNHRIQKFSPELRFIRAWGHPGAGANIGPLDFFGPRDIAVASDGTLWVTDTGNNRLLRFSPEGEPLDVLVAPAGGSLFHEPVGVVIDTVGGLLVSDAWSGRVLRFEAGGREPALAFDAGWTSHDVLAKPYIAVLADGRILVSVPEQGALVLFSPSGGRVGAWQPLANALPVGVAAMPDGGFAFSDARHNHVQIVPRDLIAALFR